MPARFIIRGDFAGVSEESVEVASTLELHDFSYLRVTDIGVQILWSDRRKKAAI